MQHHTPEDSREIRRVVLKLQGKAWGVAFGLLLGLGLFAATIILVVMGGEHPGQHLRLLGEFLPGYRVTTGGAFLGFVYMFVIGYALGRLIGMVYNRLAYIGD
jgi:amino acid permease